MKKENKIKVIYITGSGRSGSTLLDRIISSAGECFSVGELKFLGDNLNMADSLQKENKRFCDLSGKRLTESEFWKDIIEEIKRNDLKIFGRQGKDKFKLFFSLFSPKLSKGSKYDDKKILGLILRKAQEFKGKNVKVLVDSSKSLRRLIFLSRDDIDLYVVHLVRDPRGHIYSLRKKKKNFLYLFFRWLKLNCLISLYLKIFFPERKKLNINYTSFVKDPEKYIEIINQKFGINISPDNYLEETNKDIDYTFAGNNMRGQEIKEIKLDDKWRIGMPGYQKIMLSVLAFIPNKIYGQKN